MIKNVLTKFASVSFLAGMFFVSTTLAQEPPPPAAGAPPAGGTAEVERVVVTGSNIPTSEEVGPNPVDTYRREDIVRLGVRSATDLIQKLPAAAGSGPCRRSAGRQTRAHG